MKARILVGDVLQRLGELPDASVQCVVTSPPYWGLRDYGVAGQLGLEKTPEEFIAKMVAVFAEVRRVLRDDGTLWLNIGDSYCSTAPGTKNAPQYKGSRDYAEQWANGRPETPSGMKPKDLVGIPWMLAFALRADGWYLRQDIIWCLSGGTWVYARTQKGDMPIMLRDLARLRPETVQLWNGEKWTRLLGTSKSKRRGTELEIVLRSGERISCTPTHKFPTSRGLLEASDIRVGDKLTSCRLPEPSNPKISVIDNDAAWLAGLYLAEGSMSGDTIQIAGHSKEVSRWIRLCAIATKYGGSCAQSVDGNKMNIRLYGKVLVAIISELVTGRTAKNKGFAPVVWRHSDSFVGSMLSGYLSGDGAYSKERWRLGFTRNYNLERDLRTACARLGYTITLNPSTVEYKGKRVPTFRGEIREIRSGHHNEKDRNEVMDIRKARCREVYDLGVEDGPHVFALASGVLTHNSKPNPMPESVTDRCTKAHEYIFLLSKSAKYYYDQNAILEPASASSLERLSQNVENQEGSHRVPGKTNGTMKAVARANGKGYYPPNREDSGGVGAPGQFCNKRSVWTIATQPYAEAHFATYPEALVEPCILAGSKVGDTVLDPFCGSGTTGVVALRYQRKFVGIELNPAYAELAKKRIGAEAPMFNEVEVEP
jgi:DNA modification methylase